MRFGVCGIEFRNIYKNKLFYMFSCVGDSHRIDSSLGIDPTLGDVITVALTQ